MNIPDVLIEAFSREIQTETRVVRREFQQHIHDNEWVVFYPQAENLTSTNFIQVGFVFTNDKPLFIERGNINGLDNLNYNDYIYLANWKEISAIMDGTIWIKTADLKPIYIKPAPFKDLLNAEVLGQESPIIFHQAVTSFLCCGEDYIVDEILDKYLSNLTPEELRMDVVFEDVESDNYSYSYGRKTVIAYYHGEPICFIQIQGRELMGRDYYTLDIKKYHAALRDIVDKSGVYDKMVFNGVTVITDEDADCFVGVPGVSPKKYADE